MIARPIRIRYQFATAKHQTEVGQAEVDRRLAKLRGWVSDDVEVDIGLPQNGPGSVESRTDASLTVPELLHGVVAAEREGYHVVIVSCYSDPGMEAARELVSIPVIGSGQSSMHVAAQLGGRFSIIASGTGSGSRAYENPRKYGLGQSHVSTRGVGLSVMDLAKDRERTLARIAEVGRQAVDEDRAEVLILGCMSMAFHDITGELGERIGVPVVNPVPASLSLAEYLVRAGLSHSRAAYPAPPKRDFV